MWIQDIKLHNFRNYFYEKVNFNDSINIFIGDNAQGKTNLLESCYYLANATSFKKLRDKDIIKFGQDKMELAGTIRKGRSFKKVSISVEGNDKNIFVNEVEYKRNKDLKSLFKLVLFTPEDLSIIKEGPNLRRDLLDEIITSIDFSYGRVKKDYDKILFARNKLLKNRTSSYFSEQLSAFDTSLVKEGYRIYKSRLKFVKFIEKYANDFQTALTAGKENLEIDYLPDINAESFDEYYNKFLEKRDEDLRYLSTQAGIHRDDIIIKINGKNTRLFASQGQQRSAIINIKLAEVKLLREITGDRAVILLDDVFSELDEKRSNFLLENLSDYQTIITATNTKSLESVPLDKISYISDGRIRKEKYDRKQLWCW